MIQEFVVVERQELSDSEATMQRCALLLKRVGDYLKRAPAARKAILGPSQSLDRRAKIDDNVVIIAPHWLLL
ncbi:hypothetical protein [Paraburkholderia xenovorans]